MHFVIIVAALILAITAAVMCPIWLTKQNKKRQTAARDQERQAAKLEFNRQLDELIDAAQCGDAEAIEAVMEITLHSDTYQLLKWPERLSAASGWTWTLSKAHGEAILSIQLPILTAKFIATHDAKLDKLVEAWDEADESNERVAILNLIKQLQDVKYEAQRYAYVKADIETFFARYEPELEAARWRLKAIYQARLDALLVRAGTEEGNRDAMMAAATLLSDDQTQRDLKLAGVGLLAYPPEWSELVCRYIANPQFSDYGGKLPGAPKHLDDFAPGELTLLAAEVIERGDPAQAKLVLACYKFRDARGDKLTTVLGGVDVQLCTEIVKIVERANAEEFAATIA